MYILTLLLYFVSVLTSRMVHPRVEVLWTARPPRRGWCFRTSPSGGKVSSTGVTPTLRCLRRVCLATAPSLLKGESALILIILINNFGIWCDLVIAGGYFMSLIFLPSVGLKCSVPKSGGSFFYYNVHLYGNNNRWTQRGFLNRIFGSECSSVATDFHSRFFQYK